MTEPPSVTSSVVDADADALLAARAVQLARPVDQQQQDDTLDLLVLTVAGQPVAVAVDAVREVRPPGPVGQVPHANDILTGLVGGYGGALPVAELASLLRLSEALPADEQWVTVLDHPVAPLGLLVDAVVDVVSVEPEELRAPHDADGLISALLPDCTVVLDTVALLRDPRLSLTPPDPTEEPPWHET